MILVVIGMQFSHFLVSISIILLSANYLVEGDYSRKLKAIWQHKAIIFFLGLFLLHVLGLWWSTDIHYGQVDIQRKLPILALPIVLGTSKKISRNQFEWILLFFILTCTLSSVIGSSIYYSNMGPENDHRIMSPFLSHIRLSLMMGVGVFSAFYLGIESIQWKKYKLLFFAWGVWLFIYLLMLRSMSGILAFGFAVMVMAWLGSVKLNRAISTSVKMAIVISVVGFGSYIYWQVQQFYDIEEIELSEADQTSKSGEEYQFNLTLGAVENGHHVFSYVAPIELEKAWNTRSDLAFSGEDLKGQELRVVLLRYLTSKGLRKDKKGVESLTDKEIWAIENGIANVRFLDPNSLSARVYGYIWEVHNFTHDLDPQGNSFGQRLLFWQLGAQIIKENWIIGVGTGDVQLSYDEKYKELPFQIQEQYQLRAHNQYITMAITFGLVGFVYFMITLFSGFYKTSESRTYLFLGLFIILMISMLDEDTLEPQFGVTFAMYFYFLFLFQQPESNKTKIN